MRRRARRVAVVWVAGLAFFGVTLSGVGQRVAFDLPDQFDRVHNAAELRGKAAVIFGTDRKGSKFGGAWAEALRESLPHRVSSEAVAWVDIANLRGVPFFMKGSVKKKFPSERKNWVLLDWKGTFAKAYGLEKDVCNILLLDRDGRLLLQTGQTDVDPEVVSELSRAIEQLVAHQD